MDKNDYFVDRPGRGKQIANWLNDECHRLGHGKYIMNIRNAILSKDLSQALGILEYLVNMIITEGESDIGYILENNITKFGISKTIRALLRGLTGIFVGGKIRRFKIKIDEKAETGERVKVSEIEKTKEYRIEVYIRGKNHKVQKVLRDNKTGKFIKKR